MNNSIQAINIKEKLSKVSTYWDPKLVGEINGQEVKVVKLTGEFVWHDHKDADELFLVIKGHLVIHFRDKDVHADEGEIIIVPKGVEHKPEAQEEVHIILIDTKGTANTGDVASKYTRKTAEVI
ncbi:MAG TPA: cupin domain-containing protein [Patescibacteria group bacterium]|nr:cupin domain-containing protein [Patescibacteria group bacterium]